MKPTVRCLSQSRCLFCYSIPRIAFSFPGSWSNKGSPPRVSYIKVCYMVGLLLSPGIGIRNLVYGELLLRPPSFWVLSGSRCLVFPFWEVGMASPERWSQVWKPFSSWFEDEFDVQSVRLCTLSGESPLFVMAYPLLCPLFPLRFSGLYFNFV